MINRLCPEGVEFVKLGEVCKNICSGGTPATSKADYYDGDIPWLRTQEVDYCEIHATLRNITKKGLDNSSAKMIPVNCVIVAMYGATAAKVAINKIPLCTNQACCNLHIDNKKANYKFVYYWLCKQYEILKGLGEGTQHNINAMKVKKFEIPLPPLEVQNEIVRILDHFTQLEAELEAELDCRKRQYEYYRDQLLNFDKNNTDKGNNVVWKKLSEVGTFIRGNGLQKKDFTEEGVGCIHYGQIYTHYKTSATETITYCSEELAKKLRKAEHGDIVIATTSENVEDVCKAVAWLGKDSIAVSGDAYIFKHNQNPKYIAYIFQTAKFFDYKKRKANGTKVIRLSGDAIGKFEIPIPPIEEQERIVAILDRFEALTTSLQEGLPAEIAARRQQYEYYRDCLLDFKKKMA